MDKKCTPVNKPVTVDPKSKIHWYKLIGFIFNCNSLVILEKNFKIFNQIQF